MQALREFARNQVWFYLIQRRIRMAFKRWRYGLKHVHPTFYMSGESRVARDFVAGAHSFINAGCHIGPKVSIGPYVMFGPKVAIVGGDHRIDVAGTPIIFAGRMPLGPTVIEADAWVGYGVIIIAGVRIGRGAVIAAGSVVTRDVPPYEIHGGIPARKIGIRFEDSEERARHEAMLDGPVVKGLFAAARDGSQ